jgi:DNA-binding GntR family transcriptional regulator
VSSADDVPRLAPVRHVNSPVREQAVEAIRDQIMRGELREGQRLVERELCEQLDISRNTLREAYRQLEAEGFVEMRPHKGPTVTRITPREARSLYELRQALEGLAIRLFTVRATDDELEQLQRAFEDLEAAHLSGRVVDMLQRKNAFYDVLYAGADNEVLRNHARTLQSRLAQLRGRSLSTGLRPAESIAEIAHVVERIRARDALAAESAWCAHIHSAYLVVEQALHADVVELADAGVTTSRPRRP